MEERGKQQNAALKNRHSWSKTWIPLPSPHSSHLFSSALSPRLSAFHSPCSFVHSISCHPVSHHLSALLSSPSYHFLASTHIPSHFFSSLLASPALCPISSTTSRQPPHSPSSSLDLLHRAACLSVQRYTSNSLRPYSTQPHFTSVACTKRESAFESSGASH